MKANKIFPLSFTLVLALGLTTSCTREGITEPPVSGPSSFSVLLQLSASPNAVFAGLSSRGATTVTARLKKFNGEAIPNTTIYFEIVDSAGNKVNYGFFEGNTGVTSKTTDNSGETHLAYYGPLMNELTSDRTIYIRATVAWQGVESLYEFAPIDIIRESDNISLNYLVTPDVLYATDTNPRSTIKVTAFYVSKPLINYRIYFMIQSGPGMFSDGLKATFKETDSTGEAVLEYVGPLGSELSGDTSVIIRVQLTESIYKEFNIRLIKQR